MTDFIRRIVSGNKARFKDGNLDLELDLVYITDQIIIMGYPASGIEGLYRNRREDTKKFLEHRHGKKFWVFNLCPIRENSYPDSIWDGRVSRFPFPDHHAPPLAIMPLFAREMRIWLTGDPDRVAVIHCKAGKGRSGTMACTYLLSLDEDPTPPRLQRSYNSKQWAKIRADDVTQAIPEDRSDEPPSKPVTPAHDPSKPQILDAEEPRTDSPTPIIAPVPVKSFSDSLQGVLDLHTSRRMKAPSSPDQKAKQGVSIPSQRRWLHYWSLILAHEAPSHLWALPGPSNGPAPPIKPKVRLTQIKLRMKETSGMKMNLVKMANMVLDRTNVGKSGSVMANLNGNGHVWVSLARYNDDFVDLLERWEVHTRDEGGHMGRRKKHSNMMDGESVSNIFADGNWDKEKMVRSFARLGAIGENPITKEESKSDDGEDRKVTTYSLRPLSNDNWTDLRDGLPEDNATLHPHITNSAPISENNSVNELTPSVKDIDGVILDAGREVRVKLYMGQVFMGWIWFIPTFHMPHPTPTSSSSPQSPTRFVLTRKEIDFPLGVGSAIIDVEISLEWVPQTDSEDVQPPARQTSEESKADEPTGFAATVEAVTSGRVGDAVEAKQAAEN